MKTLLITNIKGGVGKSSTAVAIAGGIKLLEPKAKVLLIDGDPQGSIKTYFGLKLGTSEDFSTFLMEDTPFENALQKLTIREVGDIDVMISSRRLADADMKMSAFPRREETLRMRFKQQNINYDYCIIDSSPAMNVVLLNFLTFAENWLIPATMDAFSATNIGYLFEQKKVLEKIYERTFRVLGILPTIYDRRTIVSQAALKAISEKYGKITQIFDPIPVDSIVKRAQVKRQMIYDFLGESRAAEAYKKLCIELLRSLNG